MKVQLMLTCLCDALYGEVGIASVKVLRAAGCEVHFPESQTCCGQPPFNSGDWSAARSIAERNLRVFTPDVPIVTPSASCAAMIRDGYRLLWPDQEPPQCFELAEFLVHNLGIDVLPFNSHETPMNRKVTFHRACHGRGIGLKGEQETLLESAPGLELIPLGEPEQCCGFGGAFSATQGKLSEGIGMEKLRHVVETGADMLVSGDMGCLMHLSGLAKRAGIRLEMRHYLEVLAEALPI